MEAQAPPQVSPLPQIAPPPQLMAPPQLTPSSQTPHTPSTVTPTGTPGLPSTVTPAGSSIVTPTGSAIITPTGTGTPVLTPAVTPALMPAVTRTVTPTVTPAVAAAKGGSQEHLSGLGVHAHTQRENSSSKPRPQSKGSRDPSQDKHRRKEALPAAGPSSSQKGKHPERKEERREERREERKGPAHYTSFTPDSRDNRLKRPSTFLCKVFFANGMPEPASQQKLIPLKADPSRYTSYVGSSLEKEHRHRLHLEADLGIPLDLLDMSPYIPPPAHERPLLDPEDEALLRDDDISATSGGLPAGKVPGQAGTPSRPKIRGLGYGDAPPSYRTSLIKEKPSVEGLNFLLSTQYITPMSLEAAAVKKDSLTEREAKMLALQLELADDQECLATREGRIRYIEDSFKAAQKPPVHPTNPSLTPVEVLPLLPYVEREGQRFLNVIFDEEPLRDAKKYSHLSPAAKDDLEAQAIMKQYKTPATAGEPAKPFLAYMVPTASAKEQTEGDLEQGKSVGYTWIREYYYELHVPKAEGEKEALIFCFDDDKVQYLKVKGRLSLNKLKKMEAARENQKHEEERERERIPVPSKISVRKVAREDLPPPKKARRDEEEGEAGEREGRALGTQDD